MDAAQLNQLLTGLNALTAQLQAQNPAPAAITNVSPYEGDAIDVTSRTGQALFQAATQALDPDKPYDGRSESLYPFIAALKGRAKTCKWDSGTHSILTNIGAGNLNLLTDYGRIPKADLTAARTARDAAGGSVRARQNARMLYQCIWNSLTSDMRETLDTDPELTTDINEDGPLLFHKLVSMSHQTTFIQANSMRDALSSLHPKRFNYDIKETNEFIRRALRIMRAASEDGKSPSKQEALYFIFNVYKKIKSPQEWVQTIQFYENQMGSDPTLASEEKLYEQAKTLQEKIEKSPTGWKPSDRSPEEQVIAMLAEQKKQGSQKSSEQDKHGRKKDQRSRSRRSDSKSQDDSSKEKKRPPFNNSRGKEGDTKTWEGKTWYYCSSQHKDGHWVTHKPSECRAKKRSPNDRADTDRSKDKSNDKIQVDRNKLKQSMSAVFQGSGLEIDPEQLLNAAFDALDQE